MSAHAADPLKLTLQLAAEAGELQVRAESELGEAYQATQLPAADLLNDLPASAPHPRPVLENVGRSLRQVLFAGQVDQLFQAALSQSKRAKQQLHLELRFDPDQVDLARYPWELLAGEYGNFPVQQGQIDLSRYITFPQTPPRFEIGLSGQTFLQVVPQPQDLPPLQVGKPPIEPVRVLAHASFDDFERVLLVERQAVWGLQFDGHGCLVKVCPNCGSYAAAEQLVCERCRQRLPESGDWRGALAFERDGLMDAVPVREIGAALYNAGVQLVLLFACESGVVGGRQVFNGVAPGLLLAGVPVVIGMQYAIPDVFASRFAENFYRTFGGQADVLAAVRQARRLDTTGGWYSPVVYQRWQPALHETRRLSATYRSRHIDSAAPGQVQSGAPFLARLWIRRPETPPASEAELRQDLNVPPGVSVRSASAAANLKFEPLPGEQEHLLRRGAVEVRLAGVGCEVVPPGIPLFVDESLDAPPAIFTVTCRKTGPLTLVFSVWQDGAQAAVLTQPIEALDRLTEATAGLNGSSLVVPVAGQPAEIELLSPFRICSRCGATVLVGAKYCPTCGSLLTTQTISEHIEPLIGGTANTSGTMVPSTWKVTIDPPSSPILVSPGEPAKQMLTVSNQGSLLAIVRLLLRGEAAGWSSCTASPFQLMPGETFQAELTVYPPPDMPPGLYPLQLEVVSETEPDENFTSISLKIQVQEVGAIPDQPGCLTAILQRLFPGAVILLFLILLLRAGFQESP